MEVTMRVQTNEQAIGVTANANTFAVPVSTAPIYKGDPGKDGEPGYTPIKGVDYFDGEDGYTPIKGKDYFDGEPGYTPVKGRDYFDGENGKDGKDGYTPIKGVDYFDGVDGQNGKDGQDYILTAQDKEEIANLTIETISPVLDGKMEYYIINFDGTAFKHNGTTLTFNEIKTLCMDEKNFVYAQYSNRLYIPQYVSNNNIFFQATYITSDKPEIHRVSINNLNQVSQYNYTLAKESAIPTDSHINALIDTKLGVIENGNY